MCVMTDSERPLSNLLHVPFSGRVVLLTSSWPAWVKSPPTYVAPLAHSIAFTATLKFSVELSNWLGYYHSDPFQTPKEFTATPPAALNRPPTNSWPSYS